MPQIDGRDTDTLTLEQLRELALGAATPTEAPENTQEQPRDGQGRFAAVPESIPTVDEIEEEQTEQPTEFVRTIDLGDGSGVQVFRGATAEEVADKLVEAQKNASRKIRSDNQELKNLQAKLAEYEAQKSAAPLTDDERYMLSQQLQTDPLAAVDEILRRRGLDPKKLQAAVQRIDQEEVVQNNVAVFQQWMANNPDFVDTESNGRKIGNYLQRFHNGVATTAAIDQAYQTLKADGLLQEKAQAQAASPVVRRSSGLSARRSSPPPPPPMEDPYQLSMEELRRRANGGKDFGGW